MNIADYIISYLHANGVSYVFGYPGSPLVPLVEAIERHPEVTWVLMRHENSAALAASAQAKITGTLSVCVATSGPGALNFICGVVDGHLDRVHMLALTGQVPTSKVGHWEFQDVDHTSLFGTLLQRSASCIHKDQVAALLRNYIGHAQQQSETVHLALPSDILLSEVDERDGRFELDPKKLPQPLSMMPPPDAAFDIVAKDLEGFEQLVIVLGRRAQDCGEAIEHLAEKLGAPIISSLDGKGIVDESHPNSLGVLGIFGFPAVEATKTILERADAVLAFGVDTLKPFLTDNDNVQRRVLIQCEPGFNSLTQEYHRARTLVGPLDSIAEKLRDRVQLHKQNALIDALGEERQRYLDEMTVKVESANHDYVHPMMFLLALNEYLNEDTTVVLDTGAHTLWAAQFLQLTKRQGFIVSSHLGTMGFSLPASIATQLTLPHHRVVTITGDGGFQMVIGELATAVENKLPLVIVVFNNGILQNVAAQQSTNYGTVLANPDFVAVARAYGADGAVVDGSTDIQEVLTQAFAQRDVPFLIDLRTDPESEVPLSKWEMSFQPVTVN